MSQRTRSVSPQLRAFKMLRLLDVLIDAWADHNWSVWETALLAESSRPEGWHEDHASRAMREHWGVTDRHGLYLVAGLSERQAQIADMHYERQMQTSEIAAEIGTEAVTVRVHLYNVKQRLRKLAQRVA